MSLCHSLVCAGGSSCRHVNLGTAPAPFTFQVVCLFLSFLPPPLHGRISVCQPVVAAVLLPSVLHINVFNLVSLSFPLEQENRDSVESTRSVYFFEFSLMSLSTLLRLTLTRQQGQYQHGGLNSCKLFICQQDNYKQPSNPKVSYCRPRSCWRNQISPSILRTID